VGAEAFDSAQDGGAGQAVFAQRLDDGLVERFAPVVVR
jgi:hypothetical protein